MKTTRMYGSITALACLFWCCAEGSAAYLTAVEFGNVSWSSPLGIRSAPGETNRLFIVEQGGRIVVITNLASPTRTTFFDISDRALGGGEQGLLGLAFHPGYGTNRFFFIFYTITISGTRYDRLARFEISPSNPNQGLTNSEVVLISQPDDFSNHNAGDLHFGPDGYLYVSLGDEGDANDTGANSQRIDKDFFAGMLRLDVDKRPGSLLPTPHPAVVAPTNYAVPPDNPFVGATQFNGVPITGNVRTEFWAVGLRNPWRFFIDELTGVVYCGDVGQGAREEIDIIVKGGNYGWNYREGYIQRPGSGAPPAGFRSIPPILDYARTPSGATNVGFSVTGGVVYRGNRLPQLNGAYVFADYGSGNIWATRYDGSVTTNVPFWQLTNDPGISAFGIDPRNGDVLMADISENKIKRLVYQTDPGGTGPSLTTSKAVYAPGETIVVNFTNAAGSGTDWIGLYNTGAPNTTHLTWKYTPGGANGSVSFSGEFSTPGNYEARLFFNDNFALQASVGFSVQTQTGPPGPASNPSPTHNATGVSLNPTLTWTAGSGATSHRVFFGTSATLGTGDLKATQGATSYSPGSLAALTTYFWRIDEVNSQGTNTGPVWSFTTAAASSGPSLTTSKAVYAPGETIVVNFSQAAGSGADWIGLYNAGAGNGAYLTWAYTPGGANGSVSFAGFSSLGNYEARLFFNNNFTLQASVGFSVQTQTGPPGPASNPSPAHNATGVSLNPTLTWTAGSGATSHRIFFGTSATLGAADLKATQGATSYSPGSLAALTTYFWRIDEVNSQGTNTGPVWSFTTAAASSGPSLTTSKAVYAPGETIVVTFSNAAGSGTDWIGLYNAGAPNTAYLTWAYTSGGVNGSVSFGGGLITPGNYQARLFFNNDYTLRASVAFSVQSGGGGGGSKALGLRIMRRDQAVSLEFEAVAGETYIIETSTDLNHWAPIATGPSTAGRTVLVQQLTHEFPQRFYRLAPKRE